MTDSTIPQTKRIKRGLYVMSRGDECMMVWKDPYDWLWWVRYPNDDRTGAGSKYAGPFATKRQASERAFEYLAEYA